MPSKLRRFELLLPVRFNDGRDVPEHWLGEALNELVERFGAASFERQSVEGRWRGPGKLYRDDLSRLIVDVPDTPKNRRWMRAFRDRWCERLEQLELWMVSYLVELE